MKFVISIILLASALLTGYYFGYTAKNGDFDHNKAIKCLTK